jgi:hypothetical protein
MALALAALPVLRAWAAPTPAELEFFESKVRPVLVNNCYKCHSQASERVKGGLRLDTAADLLRGGNSGTAIVPGDAEHSLLIKAVRYHDDDLKMPPNDRKLPDSQIADLEQWIRMGAPDPRTTGGGPVNLYEVDKAAAAKHWAFQPIFPPNPPKADDPDHWIQTPIDNYILARLRQEGLSPSGKADKTTLIRRATFDLTGLPPTWKEVQDFIADNSPNAFSNVVARLLDSPRYGERWGRYWLDIARYADTKGANSDMDGRYPYAFTYRDWVIKAFNDDLPYDKFLMDQLAGDQLPGEPPATLAALGFLTVGNRFANNQDDVIDDRIDVVCKGTLALTVTCARCHDHKFDPIPTMDYYSLHGIFASSAEPEEEPLLQPDAQNRSYKDFQRQLKTLQTTLDDFRRDERRAVRSQFISQSGAYMLAVAEAGLLNEAGTDKLIRARQLNRRWFMAWKKALDPDGNPGPIFAAWVQLAAAAGDGGQFNAKARMLADKADDPLQKRLLSSTPGSLAQLASRYSGLFLQADARQRTAAPHAAGSTNTETDLRKVAAVFDDNDSPLYLSDRFIEDAVNRDRKARDRMDKLEKAIADLQSDSPGAPLRAMSLVDKADAHDSYVHIKGNAGGRGPEAPRRFLAILSPDDRPLFRDGSGRLDLARDIATDDNPLTARVMVNRIWLGHFGEGLVNTPNDFGLRSEPPSHPELLDYLAWEFMDKGWSIKKMHMQIMLSSAYQQSSEGNPRQAQIDPLNRLLWRANRRRLDFEALRDTILYIGGRLDLTMGGHPVKLDDVPYSERRTVYGLVDRGNLANMYRAFDFANPDLCTGRRSITTVPQQALFLMNSPLVVEQAMNLVRRADFASLSNNRDRVRLLYRLLYQRDPGETEYRMALAYLASEPTMPKAALEGESPWEYGEGQFDAISKRLRSFVPLRRFAQSAWVDQQGGCLSATGGCTSASQNAMIRRWVSPFDGVVNVEGSISQRIGGGLTARVVSSRQGELGEWPVSHSTSDASLKSVRVTEGEALDFVVEAAAGGENADFEWSPIVTAASGAGDTTAPAKWPAREQFSGTVHRRLYVWEKLAQVLLETNELAYYN